ncbi:hypothetical protein IWQ56_002257, partial [Coemansia nantahalensis]
ARDLQPVGVQDLPQPRTHVREQGQQDVPLPELEDRVAVPPEEERARSRVDPDLPQAEPQGCQRGGCEEAHPPRRQVQPRRCWCLVGRDQRAPHGEARGARRGPRRGGHQGQGEAQGRGHQEEGGSRQRAAGRQVQQEPGPQRARQGLAHRPL